VLAVRHGSRTLGQNMPLITTENGCRTRKKLQKVEKNGRLVTLWWQCRISGSDNLYFPFPRQRKEKAAATFCYQKLMHRGKS